MMMMMMIQSQSIFLLVSSFSRDVLLFLAKESKCDICDMKAVGLGGRMMN